jgi:pimeloyl-ACP methyl ester carboxylesterase
MANHIISRVASSNCDGKYSTVRNNNCSGWKHKQELLEELGVYMVAFDRAGYGESDPDPRRSPESAALDIQDLADALGLGDKFHLVCSSLGSHAGWAAVRCIPHRLAGLAMMAPVINYRWRGLPRGLAREAAGRRPVVAPGRLLRAVAAALVDEPAVAAHLHRRRRLRALPQRAGREEPRHGALQRHVPLGSSRLARLPCLS